jgi:hypothetical protein
MQDSDITNGSVESTKAEKVQFAKDSLEFNVQNKSVSFLSRTF